MTSKEFIQNEIDNLEDLLENAKKDNCNVVRKECEADIKQYNQVLKDLEELEELKKIMGTPIQDIMKRLKVLDIIQNYAIKYDNCVCISSIFYDKEVMEWCE